jgi:hypothetical protein
MTRFGCAADGREAIRCSSRREEAPIKFGIRNSEFGIGQSLLTSVATSFIGIRRLPSREGSGVGCFVQSPFLLLDLHTDEPNPNPSREESLHSEDVAWASSPASASGVPPGVCAGGETPLQLAAGTAALRGTWRAPTALMPGIGTMNGSWRRVRGPGLQSVVPSPGGSGKGELVFYTLGP